MDKSLNELTWRRGLLVKYKGMEYKTGNFYNNFVELYDTISGGFYATVSCSNVEVIDVDKVKQGLHNALTENTNERERIEKELKLWQKQ